MLRQEEWGRGAVRVANINGSRAFHYLFLRRTLVSPLFFIQFFPPSYG